MRDFFEVVGFIAAIFGGAFLLCVLLFLPLNCADTNKWNEGIHKNCGGYWQYEQAIGHMYITEYVYCCDKCGTRTEFLSTR